MHRFPNPGSDIKNSIESLKFLIDNIDESNYFDLFDMKELLVLNGFISSSGHTGMEALQRSENTDRSRDQTYNQCKMYSEIFRALGWLGSIEQQNNIDITLFGLHALNSKVKPEVVFERCILGLENPNEILDIKLNYKLRPFLAILKFAKKLEGKISRDEMIYGPLFLKNDKDDDEVNLACEEIISCRNNSSLSLKEELNKKTEIRGITHTTASNYTRFPIAAIQWVGWFIKRKGYFHLTEYGYEALNRAESMSDNRFYEINDTKELENLSKFAYYQFLIDFGYELGEKSSDFEDAKSSLPKDIVNRGTLFSPFSTVNYEKLSKILKFSIQKTKRKTDVIFAGELDKSKSYSESTPFKLIESSALNTNNYSEKVRNLLKEKPLSVVESIKSEVRKYKKEEFYPWVAEVFSVLGINCNIPQHGKNSVRWDAILINEDQSDCIPIELKSPTEELHISTKAIRQALENKVVIKSRGALPNNLSSSTLAIGFELPNQRSEVNSLISAFKHSFGLSVAVIGVDYLINLSIKCIQENKKILFSSFSELQGIIDE